MSEKTHTGGCHCGAVRYEARLDLEQPANRCNCTFCTQVSCANVLVKPEAFRLTAGADRLVDYMQAGHPNHYPFCGVCGVHSHAHVDIPEVGGKMVTIHVNTLDGVDLAQVKYVYWDGRHNNWHAGPRPTPWPVTP